MAVTLSVAKTARVVAQFARTFAVGFRSPFRLAHDPGFCLSNAAPVGNSFYRVAVDVAWRNYHTTTTLKEYPQTGIDDVLVALVTHVNIPPLWQSAELGESLYIAGGTLTAYDGSTVAENDFHYPPCITTTPTTPAGGTWAAYPAGAPYRWAFVWEWLDAKGQIRRSAPTYYPNPGDAGPVTAANDHVRFTVNNLNLTTTTDAENVFSHRPSLVMYRTVANGDVFYRVGITVGEGRATIDPATTADLTIDDSYTTVDDVLDDNQRLYTEGNVLEHEPAPACSLIVAHRNRLYVAGCEDPKEVWYSNEVVQDEAVSFSGARRFRVDSGGDISGLASLDEKLIIFKSNAIFVVTGQGPNDTGAGNDLSDPQEIASDAGCINAHSIVKTPVGIMFQSARGFYLLSRGLQCSYIGAQVETTLASAGVCVGAPLVEDQHHVRFACSLGTVFVYDYLFSRWATHTNATAQAQYLASAAVIREDSLGGGTYSPGAYVMLCNNGAVLHELSSSFTDPSSDFIERTYETAWIRTAGIQGFQRVRKLLALFRSVTDQGVTIYVGYDYETTYSRSMTWTATQITALLSGDRAQLVYPLQVQKCEAIRFKIVDTASGTLGTGEGMHLVGLAIEVGVKRGAMKRPAAAVGT